MHIFQNKVTSAVHLLISNHFFVGVALGGCQPAFLFSRKRKTICNNSFGCISKENLKFEGICNEKKLSVSILPAKNTLELKQDAKHVTQFTTFKLL